MSEDNKEQMEDYKQKYLNFSNYSKFVMNDMVANNSYHGFSNKYDKDKIQQYLDNPENSQKQLRDISRILYNKSSHYRRLISYFAKMPLFSYIVEPYGFDPNEIDIDKFQKQYQNVLSIIDKMNIKHEFMKVLTIAFREDVFYGYEFEEKESYYIQKLDPSLCKITTIEDGCFNFAFDMSYFNQNKNKLNQYPEEFSRKYAQYQETKEKWQELDSSNTICIKINEDTTVAIPPFSGVFEELFDIAEYKSLRKTKERMGIFKVLVQKLPMKQNSEDINDFLIDFDTMLNFHNKASDSLPDEIGLITSPMDINAIDISNKQKDEDNVAKTERDYWASTGVSQMLFSSDTSVGLDKSIKTDEEIVFAVLRQFERWINRKIKKELKTYKYFKVNLLNITVFNSDDVFKQSMEAAKYGLPTTMMAASALGISPSSLTNMAYLENDVLKIKEKFVPLQSSHTSSSDDNNDPNQTKDGDDLSEEGVKTRDGNKNNT